MNTLDTIDAQVHAVATFFDELAERHPHLPQPAQAANDARLAQRA
jgi:hypothetical protein